jgi:uncharacterized membrane protein YuzA (DUF378 family)
MKALHMISFILVIVGALNWGLVAFDFNLVSWLLGSMPVVEKIVYALVGVAAIYEVAIHKKVCKTCDTPSAM